MNERQSSGGHEGIQMVILRYNNFLALSYCKKAT